MAGWSIAAAPVCYVPELIYHNRGRVNSPTNIEAFWVYAAMSIFIVGMSNASSRLYLISRICLRKFIPLCYGPSKGLHLTMTTWLYCVVVVFQFRITWSCWGKQSPECSEEQGERVNRLLNPALMPGPSFISRMKTQPMR